jgi:hypothetical protein
VDFLAFLTKAVKPPCGQTDPCSPG